LISRARLLSSTFVLDRIARFLAVAREEIAFRWLREADWTELSEVLYGRTAKYHGATSHNESGLFAFERAAIEEFFPAPPASVLVGACGGGRELLALRALGYRIAAAYDPVTAFVSELKQDARLTDISDRIHVGSHQTLRELCPLVESKRESIDAVVVGWGSYTHVLGSKQRVQFLRSVRALCPRAPVLLSFFTDVGDDEGPRVNALRATLVKLLGTGSKAIESGDRLHRGIGGVHFFTEASFTDEVRRAGYDVLRYREHDFSYAHAVLSPRAVT